MTVDKMSVDQMTLDEMTWRQLYLSTLEVKYFDRLPNLTSFG
jgi:hypothetical protein